MARKRSLEDLRSLEHLFWAKVDRSGECWLWTAYTMPNGYGTWRQTLAHRVAYELSIGPIPDGLQLDHLCRVRNCVRPDHLEPVTCRENLLRGDTITARCVAATHCPHGHPYDEANTYRSPTNGSRSCRACSGSRVSPKQCSVEDCANPLLAKGLCRMHYQRWRTRGTTDKWVGRKGTPCSVDGCDRAFLARGLCHLHYDRLMRTGCVDLMPRARRADLPPSRSAKS